MVSRVSVVLGLLAVSLAVLPSSASAAACGAGLKVTDAAGAGALYATHELTVTGLPAGGDTFVDPRTVSAPGARRVDASDPEQREAPTFIRDTPGPLTISAVVETTGPSGSTCTQAVSTTVALRAPLSPLVKIKRPRRFRVGNGDMAYPDPPTFRLTLTHRTGSNRMPITVRARSVKRRKLPGKGATAHLAVFAQRASDSQHEPTSTRCLLICPKRTSRGFSKSTEVRAFPIESSKVFSRGLRVQLIPPTGYPARGRGGFEHMVRTPFGADIELLQGSKRVARLRVAGLCRGSGQSSRCRFRKISTRR